MIGSLKFCQYCDVAVEVLDEFEDQIGYEERAWPVYVILLECGHDIVRDIRR